MPRFDAELYLRLIGERMLTEPGGENRGARRPAIAEAAAALMAIEAIDAPGAESVLDDYSFAMSLRSDAGSRRRAMLRGPQASSEAKPLKARRVVPCGRTIEQGKAALQVRYVSLSEESTALAVTWHPGSAGPWGGGPPSATITDDRGTTETATFSGGGSNQGMRGRLICARPLAPGTAWIELDGTRLELTGKPSGFSSTLEPLPEQDPAHRYLWQRIAEPGAFDENGIEPAIDALVAARALFAHDPLLDEMRSVLEVLQRRGAIPGAGSPSGATLMREPWRSLLARDQAADGPTGSILLGAVPPAFDGFSVAVLDLESDENKFRVDAEVAPAVAHRMPFDWGMGPRQLEWWAKDDRGNHYLGQPSHWSFNDDYGHGLIDFHPPLDPRATRLELMPTAQTTRAVISFSLPWAQA